MTAPTTTAAPAAPPPPGDGAAPSAVGSSPLVAPSLWRNRDFMVLWTGQVVSTVGTRMSSLAYPLLALGLGGSPAWAGVVAFAQTLPYLLWYLPAGALVDRWDRRRVMMAADAGRALAMAAAALGVAAGWANIGWIAAAAFVESSLFVFFQLSELSAIPHVVSKEQLPAAIAHNQAREQGAELAGQPLGGALFGLSPVLPFAANAVSYLVSFAALFFVRVRFQGDPPARKRLAAEVREGVRWLWQHRPLRALVALIGASNFTFSAVPLVMIVRARELGASPVEIGGMLAVPGLAAILGSLAAPALGRRFRARSLLIATNWGEVIGLVALVVAPTTLALGLAAGSIAILGPIFNVVVSVYRYAEVPDHLQARTQSASRLFAWGAIPLGSLAGGLLVDRFGPAVTLALFAAATAVIAAAATMSRAVRSVRSPHEVAPAPGRPAAAPGDEGTRGLDPEELS